MDRATDQLDDMGPRTHKILKKNYGIICRLSGLIPRYDGVVDKILSTIHYCLGFLLVGSLTVALGVTSFYSLADVEVFVDSVHMTLIAFCCTIVLVEAKLKRKILIEFHSHEADNFFEYEEEDLPEVGSIMARGEKMKNFWKKIVPPAILANFLMVVVISPLMNHLAPPKQIEITSVNIKLPFTMWTPYDSTSALSFSVTCLMQIIAIAIGCTVIITAILFYVIMSENLCIQLFILKYSFTKLKERVRLYNGKNPHQACVESLHYCFRQNIKHHTFIVMAFQLYQKSVNGAIFFALFSSSIMLAADGVALSESEGRITAVVKTSLFIVCEVIFFFTFCWYGERINSLALEVQREMYDLEWETYPPKMKKSLIIMLGVCNRPLILKAGGLIPVTMETFGNILNAGYSYYNLLVASK